MAKKKMVIEIVFEEVKDDYDEDWISLVPVKIARHKATTLTEGEMDSLGESVAQMDSWQIDRWIEIQAVLGGEKSIKVVDG